MRGSAYQEFLESSTQELVEDYLLAAEGDNRKIIGRKILEETTRLQIEMRLLNLMSNEEKTKQQKVKIRRIIDELFVFEGGAKIIPITSSKESVSPKKDTYLSEVEDEEKTVTCAAS